jgi:hypothetical protein
MRSAQVADGGAAKPRRTVAVHNALAAMEYVRQGKHADAQLLLLPLVVSATFRCDLSITTDWRSRPRCIDGHRCCRNCFVWSSSSSS